MNILALDPATRTGWAHTSGASGTWDLSVRRDESAGMRLIRLRGKLNNVLEAVPVDLVVYEAARHAAPKMQGALVVTAQLQAVIQTWCHDKGVEYRGFSPSEVKKHATGRGDANKNEVIAAALNCFKLPDGLTDDNHADALWLLELAKEMYE